MNKKLVVQGFLETFQRELSTLTHSAKEAHEAATHTETRAEDRHDTFAIEASYLAAGQAKRVSEIAQMIEEYQHYLEDSASSHQRISLGTLAVIQQISSDLKPLLNSKKMISFIAKTGGGTQIKVENEVITVITPNSPLGEPLLSSKTGDEFSVEAKSGIREYKVLNFF